MKYALGFLLGAAVGAAVAFLFAPSTGQELRTKIKSQVDTQYARVQDEWQKGMQEMQSRMDKMNNDLQAIANRSGEVGEEA